jgi:hypothetical protein
MKNQSSIMWNPGNKVVQDHRDGTIIQPDTDIERKKRGLPVPWTPDVDKIATKISGRTTEFGFEWGAAKVTRLFSDDRRGWVTVGLETPKLQGHDALQIYVTRTGKVRIYGPTGEWKPKVKL